MIFERFAVGPLQCNCCIVGDEVTREAVVVDPGDDVPGILARLQKHRLIVRQIIITHAHIDHVGGAAQLKQLTGAPVLLNQNDLALLGMMQLQADLLGLVAPEVAPPDGSADDGDLIGVAGLQAEVLHTPGHSPGSICLLFNGQGLLLAGDTLFAGAIGRTDFPGGDARQILRSLRDRLLVLPDTVRVVPGHGRETTIGEERQSNPFLQPNFRM